MPAADPQTESFSIADGDLLRSVVPRRGKPYEHRCPLAAFEQVAYAVEELGDGGGTIHELVAHEAASGRYVSFTNVAVALAFLRERSIIDVRRRRNYPATTNVHLDAMTEFHALAEEPAEADPSEPPASE